MLTHSAINCGQGLDFWFGEAMKTALWQGSSPQATDALCAALARCQQQRLQGECLSVYLSVCLSVLSPPPAGGRHLRTEAGSEPFGVFPEARPRPTPSRLQAFT